MPLSAVPGPVCMNLGQVTLIRCVVVLGCCRRKKKESDFPTPFKCHGDFCKARENLS
jgi:hypothetical protein